MSSATATLAATQTTGGGGKVGSERIGFCETGFKGIDQTTHLEQVTLEKPWVTKLDMIEQYISIKNDEKYNKNIKF